MRTFILVIALLIAPAMTSAQSNFTRTNPAGPHPVGLQVIEQYDHSRGYRGATDPYNGQATIGERARPIQTFVWYPAEKGTGREMIVGSYLELGGTSDEFPSSPAERQRLQARYVSTWIGALSADRARTELAAPMNARRDATASAGKYPVIIYAPSYRAFAFENADLCELLASHGYVVISSPSIGQSPEGMTDDLEGAQTQLGDIQFLISYAHRLPQADTNHLAVTGYSWGGLANVMAAAKDSRIDALVSLDGSVLSYPDVIDQSRFLTPERITVPMLYVAATPRHLEDLPSDMNQERSFLNKMKYADLYRVTLASYVHSNFSVMGQRFLSDSAYGNYDQHELSVANGWLETYVLRFLDAHLKGDAAGQAFLEMSPTQVGAPAHLFTVYRTKAQGAPPTRASFAAELASKGFDQALAIYQAMQKREPGFSLSDNDLNSWGYKLLRDGQVSSAIAILRLNSELHADSWNAFDSLGEAYAGDGNKPLAIEAYRKSLSLNPGNKNAADQLAKLGAKH
ncbi:MAG: dienelactone hydrolase [Burkholderiales bacterium]|nr:MAG: dienelactone hydrolase [Burkholderiales bacterium]